MSSITSLLYATNAVPRSTFTIDPALLSSAAPLLSSNDTLSTHDTRDREGQGEQAGLEFGNGPELNARVGGDAMQFVGEGLAGDINSNNLPRVQPPQQMYH